MDKELKSKQKEIQKICKDLQIKRLYAFGSSVKDQLKEGSDLDFLISFSDDLSFEEYSDNFFSLHYRLRELFNREIDIITERSLSNPYLIESINETKELFYEAGS
jgi:predicted nucleotidyltransferase